MWIDEYEKLMFSDTNSTENIVQAVQLKYQNMPEIFYKYRNVNNATLDAFRNDTLYFSAISLLNDPYECALMLPAAKFKERTYSLLFEKLRFLLKPLYVIPSKYFYSESLLVDKILEGFKMPTEDQTRLEITKIVKEANDDINKHRLGLEENLIKIADEFYRVCSFSEIMDSKLMWSHYADQHKGFCIGYNFKEIDDDLRELMVPIIYCDNLLDSTKSIFGTTNNSLIMNGISRKSVDWNYEREWRILITPKNKEKCQPQKVPVPKTVYLGSRISQENKMKIVEIAKSKHIDVYQMKMRTDEFKLYSEKIID